jgi:hypothetical protein
MANKYRIQQYRNWYAKLLRLYPKAYYQRFGEEMEQTFNDLLQERAKLETGSFGCAVWMFIETSAGILRENRAVIIMQNKNIIRIALATVVILLVPLLAMQITGEVVWDLADFAFAGALLFGAGLTYELIARKSGAMAYRAAVGLALAAAFILIWINLAVGVIGSEDNPANSMYAGVLAVGIIGAIVARLEAHGMARALFATAIAQALVALIALVAELGSPWDVPAKTLLLNGFFITLFVGSALLFRRAGAAGSKVKPAA